jgi:hypothetical protein
LVYDLDRAVQIFKAVPSLAQKLIVKSEPSSAQQPTMWRRAEKSFDGKLPPNAGWQPALPDTAGQSVRTLATGFF